MVHQPKKGTMFGKVPSKPWKRRVIFDARTPKFDMDHCRINEDWKEFYPDAAELLSPRQPPPRGKPVVVSCFCDANHAGNVITRRSHTGILIYVNNAPIMWYSKRQNTVESSTFGSEFVAMRIAKEIIVALRYKLRMFGLPIMGPQDEPEGPSIIFCDNAGVVKNTSIPSSTLSQETCVCQLSCNPRSSGCGYHIDFKRRHRDESIRFVHKDAQLQKASGIQENHLLNPSPSKDFLRHTNGG